MVEVISLIIKEEHKEHNYPIAALCKLGNVSRAAYYKWLHREIPKSEQKNKFIADEIEKIHTDSPDKGYRRIRDDLERYHGIDVNDKRVLRICRKLNIKSTIKYYSKRYKELEKTLEDLKDKLFTLEVNEDLQSIEEVIQNIDKEMEEYLQTQSFNESRVEFLNQHLTKVTVNKDSFLLEFDLIGGAILTGKDFYLFVDNPRYDIYALIQDEEQYPYANQIWEYLYDHKNGFPEKKMWIRQDADIKINPLGEIFETGEKTSASNISIIKYNNTVEFIEDIPRIKEAGYYIYCADDRAANNMLKDYYPEQYETRNLLSYPIGQFVYALHRMWDEDLQGIVLSQNGLRKCFASGWLSSNGKSSVNFTEDLERLLPYFEGCYTVDEWKARLDTFTDACHNAVDVFTVQADDPEDKRKQEDLGNPLRYFSAFSINESHIAEVMDIIDQLIRMAKALFGGNEPVSIHEHMNKLDGMLYMHKGMPKELYLEEREKVKQIFEALESEKVRDFLCYPGDLAAALLSFMGGRTDDEEQSHAGLQTLVFNIFQVEAAPIAAKEKVHICLADISRLPGAAGKYGWPLDEDVLLTIAECNKNTYLNNWIKNNRLTPLSNRYYLYTALKNKDVEISWVQKQGEKLYSPSPYITLLDKLSDTQIRGTDARLLELPYVTGIYPHKHLECSFDIRDNEKMYEHDAKLVYSLCPMRFVYEYVLGDSSAYRSEYQQNRAIVRLIQIFSKLLKGKYTIEQIAGQVFEIFPNIRKAEKRQMIDDASRWPVMEPDDAYTTYKGKNYTNYRLNLTFLDERIYEQARKNAVMLMSQEGRRGIFYDRGQQTGSRNCEFCPHSVYCMSALYGIDYKGEQG